MSNSSTPPPPPPPLFAIRGIYSAQEGEAVYFPPSSQLWYSQHLIAQIEPSSSSSEVVVLISDDDSDVDGYIPTSSSTPSSSTSSINELNLIKNKLKKANKIIQKSIKKIDKIYKKTEEEKQKLSNPLKNVYETKFLCAVCLNNVAGQHIIFTSCTHEFCSTCFEQFRDLNCAICRETIKWITGIKKQRERYYFKPLPLNR